MSGTRLAQAAAVKGGPSVVKEIVLGTAIAITGASFWKMYQWNEQRRVRTFYDLLEKGEISVVVEDE